jgi:hypothetical protein
MNRIYWLLCFLLFVSIQSCTRHKRIEIANNSSYDSLLTIVKANGKEIFKGKVSRPQSNFSSQLTTFHYGGDSCTIQVEIPVLNLTESKSFADLDHYYVVVTIGESSQNDISGRKTQVIITAVQTVAEGAAE